MRLSICFIVMLCALRLAPAQPQTATSHAAPLLLAGTGGRLVQVALAPPAGREPDAGREPGAGRETRTLTAEPSLVVNFAEARDDAVRAAAPPGLAGLAAGRLFTSEGAEWQRHYLLGAGVASIAYALDDRPNGDRCWRALAAGLLVGAAKEVADGYFDRRDFEATACGAAVTALMQAVMPRWEW